MSLERAKTDLAHWEAEAERLRTLLARAESEVQKHRAAIEVFSRYQSDTAVARHEPPSLQPAQPVEVPQPQPSLRKDSPYYGKSLAEAATLVLAFRGQPMTVAEVVRTLREAGWNFTSKNPATNLYWTLRERQQKMADVITIPGSKWALASWKPDNEHIAKTREGLAAARARGLKLGPPPKLTPEVIAKIDAMRAAGMKIADIAVKIKVSRQAIYKWLSSRDEKRPDLATILPDAPPHGRPN